MKIVFTQKVIKAVLKQDKINVNFVRKAVGNIQFNRVILRETLNSSAFYNKQEIDNMMSSKVDEPTPEEWQQIDLIFIL